MTRSLPRHSILTLLIAVLCALAAGPLAHAKGHGARNGESRPGRFDYYLVSLSWSPSYCALHPSEAEQCGNKGFGFVLHGLWPQNRNGSWPQDCRSSATPDDKTIARMLAIMPSRHLIEHEWQTHGTCSGLDPQGYFALADDAYSRIKIPATLVAPKTDPQMSADDIIKAFDDLNPGLEEGMISVACRSGGELEEVRICVDKDNLSVKACGGRVRNTCRLGKLRIPAIR
ncbi:MAG: ribonuclease T2 [Rudaea sp.]